jgi:hypothetical protein
VIEHSGKVTQIITCNQESKLGESSHQACKDPGKCKSKVLWQECPLCIQGSISRPVQLELSKLEEKVEEKTRAEARGKD